MSPTEGRIQNICVTPDLCAQNICVTPDLCVVDNFNGKDGYFTWRRTWKNLTNVARHVRLVSISLMVPKICTRYNNLPNWTIYTYVDLVLKETVSNIFYRSLHFCEEIVYMLKYFY